MNGTAKQLGARLTRLVDQAQPLLDAHDNASAQLLVDQALALDPGSRLQHPANVFVQTQAALLALRRSESEESARLAFAAQALARTLGDPRLQAHADLAVARACLSVGDLDQTLATLEAAWSQVRDGNDLTLRFWYQTNFGIAHADLGQSADSMDWYQQALATARELGSERLLALAEAHVTSAWLNLADTAHDAGDHAGAIRAWQAALDTANESLALVQRAQVVRWMAAARLNRCTALGALGQVDEALADIAEISKLGTVAEWADFRTRVHYNAAKILHQHGRLPEATAELELALEIGTACQTRSVLLLIHDLASRVAEASGDHVRALSCARLHHALHLAVAADRAAMRSRLLAVRLATEHAKAEADGERQQRIALSETNRALEERAESLRHAATHDDLTGLPNRRHLDHVLEIAHAEAAAKGRHLCLAMLDIDHFKSINDQHSHIVGDQVLKQLGSLLNSACRDRDLAARYGGEEFVVLMGDVLPHQAAAVAERLRRSIQAFNWASVVPGLQVTASFGVCDIARTADPVSGLRLADKLLYEAKLHGRNRVVCQHPPD